MTKENLITVQQASEILKISVPEIFSLIDTSNIPVIKKRGRTLFNKDSIVEWKKNHSKADLDIQSEIFISVLKAIQLNNLSQNNPIPEPSKELIHG